MPQVTRSTASSATLTSPRLAQHAETGGTSVATPPSTAVSYPHVCSASAAPTSQSSIARYSTSSNPCRSSSHRIEVTCGKHGCYESSCYVRVCPEPVLANHLNVSSIYTKLALFSVQKENARFSHRPLRVTCRVEADTTIALTVQVRIMCNAASYVRCRACASTCIVDDILVQLPDNEKHP
jgi:hypothetical protein